MIDTEKLDSMLDELIEAKRVSDEASVAFLRGEISDEKRPEVVEIMKQPAIVKQAIIDYVT